VAKIAEGRRALERVAELEQENAELKAEIKRLKAPARKTTKN